MKSPPCVRHPPRPGFSPTDPHASSPSEDEDWFATYGSSGASTPSAGGAAPLEGLLTSLLATPTDDRLCSAVVDAFCLRSSFSCQVVASPGVLAC